VAPEPTPVVARRELASPGARFVFAAPALELASGEFADAAWQDWRDPSRTDTLLASVRRAARNTKSTEAEP
jgi:hypothetical protein